MGNAELIMTEAERNNPDSQYYIAEDEDILQDINFEVKKGQTIGKYRYVWSYRKILDIDRKGMYN